MDIKKRLEAIEKAAEKRSRVPVIIAELQPDGLYLWDGKTYTKEGLLKLQEKNKAALIIDDVIGIVKGELNEQK